MPSKRQVGGATVKHVSSTFALTAQPGSHVNCAELFFYVLRVRVSGLKIGILTSMMKSRQRQVTFRDILRWLVFLLTGNSVECK